MGGEGIKLKLLLDNQPELVRAIEDIESGKKKPDAMTVCQSVGFHDDPDVHRQVVEYLSSIGCKTFLVPDGKPDKGLVGIRHYPPFPV